MTDIDSALSDIARLREQLAASSRFKGFAPGVVALTGLLAGALTSWQVHQGEANLPAWVLLAAISALLIGSEAVIRARSKHHAMADRMLSATLNRFMPVAVAGAILGAVVLIRVPEHSRLLPGLWQLLIGVGICAVQTSLPRSIIWAACFYFMAGTVSLLLSGEHGPAIAWLMGLPFGLGQGLVAAILYHASREASHG